MTAVIASLITLALGAGAAPAFACRPRAATLSSLGTIIAAGLCCVVAAAGVLMNPAAAAGAVVNPGWPLPIGSLALSLDGLSAWFLLAIGLVSVPVAIYSWGYFQTAIGRERVWAATALMNVLVGALVITICAANVVAFMLGWEAMSLSAFLLVMFHHRDPRARRGAWTYLVATHLGTAIGVLPVLCTLSAAAGSTAFARFAGAIDPSRTATCTILWLLGLVGFGAKAGLMPMHVWLPQAHPVAPSPVSALLSGVVIKTGIYGLLRLVTWLPSLSTSCAGAIMIVGAVTGVMAILYALAQQRYKRALAYSSVENIGIIAMAIGLGMLGRAAHDPILCALGFGGALLHMLNHALFKALLFLSAGAVLHGTGVDNIERLGGMMRRDRSNALLFAFGCAAICALPPLNGFVGEFVIYSGLLRSAASESLPAAALAVVGIVSLALIGGVAVAAFSRLFGVMFLGEARDPDVHVHATPAPMIAAMTLLALGCVTVVILAGRLGATLKAPLATLAGEHAELGQAVDPINGPLLRVSLVLLFGVAVCSALVALRKSRHFVKEVADRPTTWGCGYAAPTARMQYTGSSYAWSMVRGFGALLWPHRTVDPLDKVFPGPCALESRVPDAAEHDLFAPMFRATARLFRAIRTMSWMGGPVTRSDDAERQGRTGPPRVLAASLVSALRQGRVQVCLAFIVVTLLVVFAIEALSSHRSLAQQGSATIGVVEGAAK